MKKQNECTTDLLSTEIEKCPVESKEKYKFAAAIAVVEKNLTRSMPVYSTSHR